jgi:indolepyruvate ferredoxin oxidoreductase alpha subunit
MIVKGAEALAEGLYRMGVQVVTGYPGSPATGVMEAFKRITKRKKNYLGRWMINEKVSLEYALGYALTGLRTATVLKNVGFNLIMDTLAIAAHTGVTGACLIMLGDDPGALGSSHEEDARLLAVAAEVPLLEPSAPSRALDSIRRGIEISEEHRVPVVIRFTPDFVSEKEKVSRPSPLKPRPLSFRSSGEVTGFTCLPHQAISLHARLHKIMDTLSREAILSKWEGSGEVGIIGVGSCSLKIKKVLRALGKDGVKTMWLEEVNPLPSKMLLEFLAGLKKVLVVEEGYPLVEEKVASLCHWNHREVEISGKLTGHLPREDVLFLGDIFRGVIAISSRTVGEEVARQFKEEKGGWGEEKPLCPDCPYGTIVDALNRFWMAKGMIIPALAVEPGCGVRLYYPPYRKADVKLCMGSASPIISALASLFPSERPVAIIGESAFLNSGVPALIQICSLGAKVLIFIVNNYSAALTGFQPTMELARKEITETLKRVIQGAGPAFFASVSEGGLAELDDLLSKAHCADGPSVFLINAPCPETIR